MRRVQKKGREKDGGRGGSVENRAWPCPRPIARLFICNTYVFDRRGNMKIVNSNHRSPNQGSNGRYRVKTYVEFLDDKKKEIVVKEVQVLPQKRREKCEHEWRGRVAYEVHRSDFNRVCCKCGASG